MTSSAFELDRFVAGPERLEVTGRWLGVRGRRFMRPSLIAVVDGRSTRALAELEHKPWAPEDGDPWIAAFPRSRVLDQAETFELAVAPDLAVRLPPPEPAEAGRSDKTGREVVLEAVHPEDSAPDPAPRPAAAAVATVPDRLLAERDDAFELRDRAVAARENAATVRDQALAQRDEAIVTRDEALAARDEVIAARDEVLAVRDNAVAVRDQALADRKRALVQRDRAVAARDRVVIERDEALVARESAVAELGRARAELRMVRADATPLPSGRPLAPPDPPLARPDPPPAPFAFTRSAPRPPAGRSPWSTRMLTLAAMAGAGIVLLIILLTSGVAPVVGH